MKDPKDRKNTSNYLHATHWDEDLSCGSEWFPHYHYNSKYLYPSEDVENWEDDPLGPFVFQDSLM